MTKIIYGLVDPRLPLWKFCPFWSFGSSIKTGNQNVWKSSSLSGCAFCFLKISSGDSPDAFRGALSMSTAILSANGHNCGVIAMGHLSIAWRGIVHARSHNVHILCSAILFRWWLSTPASVIVWFFRVISVIYSILDIIPLSPWYTLICTAYNCASSSNLFFPSTASVPPVE